MAICPTRGRRFFLHVDVGQKFLVYSRVMLADTRDALGMLPRVHSPMGWLR